MKTLTGSLAALAIVAARENQWEDVARILVQAAHAPDCEDFLTCQLSDSVEANTLIEVCANPCESVSAASSSLADSVQALSAALVTTTSKAKQQALYDGDDFESLSLGDPEEEPEDEEDDLLIEDDELDDLEFEGDDEESNDDGEFESSSSGLRLRIK